LIRASLLNIRERLAPADHQTHRRYAFQVPPGCTLLRIHVSYAPKLLGLSESRELIDRARVNQVAAFSSRVGEALAARWSADLGPTPPDVRIPNLLTISLDDAAGVYRGAGHRHMPEQALSISRDAASPGLVPGALPPGEWLLTVSVHTLVSPQCDVSIQIEAETASS
jgi:hypothetical protein